MARDNFSKSTIQRLQSRVAHRCCNPNCRRQTAGPSTDPEGVNIVGVAAHIHAASPGGPRYLPTMSSGERRRIQNAIWLCSVCATLVDRDIEAYPVPRLQGWKVEAEKLAAKELNTRPPAHGDASAQLVAALSGQSPKFFPSVIRNAHEASAKALERLDSRFQVKSSHHGKTTTFTLSAREDVSIKLSLPPERALEWRAKVLSAIDDGLGFEINASGVKASGSPLLEQLFDHDAMLQPTIKISSQALPVRAKLTAVEPTGGTHHPFDDIEGHLFMGQKYLTFEGELWEGLAKLTMRLLHQGAPRGGEFSLDVNLDRWVDLDVRNLPYLKQVAEFFRHLDNGELLNVSIFKQGQELLGMHANFNELNRKSGSQSSFLLYLHYASEVARALGVLVKVPKHVALRLNDFNDLVAVYDVVTAPARLGRERLSANPSLTLTASENGENIKQLLEQSEPAVMTIRQSIQSELKIFGQTVRVPVVSLIFNGVFAHVLDHRLSFDAGDSVRVELEPTDGFWMSYELGQPISSAC